jgi:hypothetical protein
MRVSTGMIEPRASATEAVAIAELPAAGEVRVIAVNQAVSVPIRSPVVPPPAEATEQTIPIPTPNPIPGPSKKNPGTPIQPG